MVSKTLQEWRTVLKNSGILENPNVGRGDITKPELAISTPSDPVDQPGDFIITGVKAPIDYRKLALDMAGNDMFAPENGKEDIRTALSNDDIDPDTLERLKEYENALRTGITTPINDLRDSAQYPLILWILAANYMGPLEDQSVLLISPVQFKKLTETPPSEPAQQSA